MVIHKHRIFKNPEIIEELLLLRSQGKSLTDLGNYFSCDHTSILYQLKKHDPNLKVRAKKKNNHKVPKDKCPVCEMLLSSKYHMNDPCDQSQNNPYL